jgi:hypothetical protein
MGKTTPDLSEIGPGSPSLSISNSSEFEAQTSLTRQKIAVDMGITTVDIGATNPTQLREIQQLDAECQIVTVTSGRQTNDRRFSKMKPTVVNRTELTILEDNARHPLNSSADIAKALSD